MSTHRRHHHASRRHHGFAGLGDVTDWMSANPFTALAIAAVGVYFVYTQTKAKTPAEQAQAMAEQVQAMAKQAQAMAKAIPAQGVPVQASAAGATNVQAIPGNNPAQWSDDQWDQITTASGSGAIIYS